MSSDEEARARRARELRERIERLKRGQAIRGEGEVRPLPTPREFTRPRVRKQEPAAGDEPAESGKAGGDDDSP